MTAVALSLTRPPVLAVLSAVWSRIGIYLVLILAARNLPGAEFGVFAVLMAVAGIVNAVVSGGGDMWLNRFTWRSSSQAKRAPRVWRAYLTLCVLIAGLVTALAFAATGAAAMLWQWPWAEPAFIAIIGAALAGMAESLLAVLRASGWVVSFFGLRDFLPQMFLVGLFLYAAPTTALGAVSLYAGVWGFGLVLLVLVFVLNAGTLLPVARFKRRAWLRIGVHTAALIYGNLGSRLSIYVDVLVLTAIISLTDVGEYRVAAQFAIGFMVVQHFIFLGLPWQVRDVGTVDRPGSGHEWVVSRQRLLLLTSAAALLVLWVAAEFLLGLLGARFSDNALLFRVLLVIRFVELLWGPQHEVLISRGRIVEDAHANVVAIAVWAAVFVLLLGSVSPIAAAVIANALASAVGQATRHTMLRRGDTAPTFGHKLGMSLPLACTAGVIAAASSML